MKFDKHRFLINITSRKFLLAVASVITMLANAFGADVSETERITSLVLAVAAAIAYIAVEGAADVKKIALRILELIQEFETYDEGGGDEL